MFSTTTMELSSTTPMATTNPPRAVAAFREDFSFRIIEVFSLLRLQSVGSRSFPVDEPNDAGDHNYEYKDRQPNHPRVERCN
jgi:hypothetical protein